MIQIVFLAGLLIGCFVGYGLGLLILFKWEDVVFNLLDNTIGRVWQC